MDSPFKECQGRLLRWLLTPKPLESLLGAGSAMPMQPCTTPPLTSANALSAGDGPQTGEVPPLQVMVQVGGPFARWRGRASAVRVNGMSTDAAIGQPWSWFVPPAPRKVARREGQDTGGTVPVQR